MLPALAVLLACAACAYLSLAPRERRAVAHDLRTDPLAVVYVVGMAVTVLGIAHAAFTVTLPGCALAMCGFGVMHFARKGR